MRHNVRQLAAGKWQSIITSILKDVDQGIFKGLHKPCPACGGTDRFRFDDKDGRGSFFCANCGAGDGFDLLMRVKGWTFAEAAKEVEQVVGFAKPDNKKPAQSDEHKMSSLRRVWSESQPIARGDEVSAYLAGRGLAFPVTKELRTHPSLAYRDEDGHGRFTAMVGLIRSSDGRGASIHRTYLMNGQKAPVRTPKKVMSGLPISGGAIRLFEAGATLGIAEGIETALAAAMTFSVPVWSCVSALGIESFQPPEGVKELVIFGDNDASFTGQAAAYALAKRLADRMVVRVEIPKSGDWADVQNRSVR